MPKPGRPEVLRRSRAPVEPQDARAARVAALDMLARRDHATTELAAKLRERGYDPDVVAAVVERLLAERLVDDQRYVENFISYHAGRGQGPLRVRAGLREAGLSGPEVEEALRAWPDWIAGARQARTRKFGSRLPASNAERVRQVRFLGYRGFTSAEIRAALGWDIDLGSDVEES